MSHENPDPDRSTEEIRIGWPIFASVSPSAPQRFQKVVEADEFADDAPPPKEVSELAARSVASGASLTAVARWFDVPESELRELIDEMGDEAGADPVAGGVIEFPPADALGEPEVPLTAGDHDSGTPVPGSSRPAPVRAIPTVFSASRAVGTSRRLSSPSPMGFRNSLQVLRRWLPVAVVVLIVGAAAGWMTAPGETGRAATFRATHTLLYGSQGGQSYNIEQLALLATSGEVPSRVAARLKLDRGQVRAAVVAVANPEVATISITARSSTAEAAVSLADVTAEELATQIDGGVQAPYQAEVARLTAQLEAAQIRVNGAKNSAAQAAAQREAEAAARALEQYKSQAAPTPQLRTLENAAAAAVSPAGVRAPDSKPVRAALLGGLGLLVGLAGAFARDRLDSRIRSKEIAEEAFGVPVVAEVPRLSKASQGQLLARTQPSSPFVEAYRGLRTYVALWAPEADREDGHRVLVVTSPSAGEGKTTTVAHLAAMLAEIGRSVVVISADLRRPRLHQFFDIAAGPGLVEALSAKAGRPVFTGLDQPTSVRGVRLVPSGPPLENPAPLFEHAGDLLQAARELADFVLIDAPPLLVANDAVEMARHADGVLLVARAGQTTIEAAERSAETLERLDIPVVGTVLVASEAASSASRYYASRYYAEPERTGWLRRRPLSGNGSASAIQTPSQPEKTSPAPAETPPPGDGQ